MLNCIGGEGTFERLPDFVKEQCRRNIREMKVLVSSEARYPEVDREKVRRLTLSTLIFPGSRSKATARLTDLEFERLFPEESRKRVVFEGATHIMWVEQPVQCREVVLKFIRGKLASPCCR